MVFNSLTVSFAHAFVSYFLVAVSLIMIIYLLFLRRKDKKRLIELEQRMLLSQMNPHFVFNSLTAIQSYIFRNEPYMAGKYMASFAKLVRLVLENSRVDFIPIVKERDTLNYYLELQALRFEGKFDYSIIIDDDIDLEHHTVPPMLAQPFIENAIEHGIIHMSEKGFICIRFELRAQSIILEVEDNGVGIDKSVKDAEKKRNDHQSLATKITEERIKNIKKSRRQQIIMNILDLANQPNSDKRGTLVRFIIPLSSIS